MTTLTHHIDVAWMYEAYRQTRKSGAVGVDKVSAEEYAADLESNLQSEVSGLNARLTEVARLNEQIMSAEAGGATKEALDQALKTSSASLALAIGMLLTGVLASVWFIRKTVLKPLVQVVDSLDSLAAGDFTVQIEAHGGDELGRLATSAGRLRDDLGELIRDIAGLATELDQSGQYLTDLGTQNLSRLGAQRDGTAQVATASEELAATAREVAGGAAGAAQAAESAERSTSEGKAVVGQFSDGESMVEIQENVRGRDVFVVQPTSEPTNDNLMELLVMIDALRWS